MLIKHVPDRKYGRQRTYNPYLRRHIIRKPERESETQALARRRKKNRFVHKACVLSIIASILLLFDRFTAPYSPILGGPDPQKTITYKSVVAISALGQDIISNQGGNPQENGLGPLFHRIHRIYIEPKALYYYLLEALNNKLLVKEIPTDEPYSQIIQKREPQTFDELEIKKSKFFQKIGEYQVYQDSINGHRIEQVVIPIDLTKEFKTKLLRAPEITNTTASPNFYLAMPELEERENRNWIYIGNNPEFSHTNAIGINLKIGEIEITFGAGWLKPNPNNDLGLDELTLEKGTIYYGCLVPNNLALPATMIAEVKQDLNGQPKLIVYNPYVGDLESEQPPMFMYITNNADFKFLKGKEILNEQTFSEEGIIVQIAHFFETTKEMNNLINMAAKEDNNGNKNEILNQIHQQIRTIYSGKKDANIIIVAKTKQNKTILVLSSNRDNEAEQTHLDIKVAAAIQALIEHLSKEEEQIDGLYISFPGSNGSTSNFIAKESTNKK